MFKKNNRNNKSNGFYEFCPNCSCNLSKQKGYKSSLRAYECKECGVSLLNPNFEDEVVWYCDSCGAILIKQSNRMGL